MSTWHNSLKASKEYQRVFDFGCSYTNYKWLTWSDMIALSVNTDNFYKNSLSGAGLKMIYHQLRHQAQSITDKDLVLVCLTTMDRYDVYNNYDYTEEAIAINPAWSSNGSVQLKRMADQAPQCGTSFRLGHHGDPAINLFNMFLDNYVYLDLILNLFQSLPCDKVLITTDEHQHDVVEYCKHDGRYDQHISGYLPDNQQNLRRLLFDLRTEYAHTIDLVNQANDYSDFWLRIQAQKPNFPPLDPHPSPDEAYAFVSERILHHSDQQYLRDIMPVIQDNYDKVLEWCYRQPKPDQALQQFHHWSNAPDDHEIPEGIIDMGWLQQHTDKTSIHVVSEYWPEHRRKEFNHES